jgi:hypothetical protein
VKCRLCNEEIILVPSAKARAEKHGGSPQDYTRLFTTHTECALRERREQTSDLMERIRCAV